MTDTTKPPLVLRPISDAPPRSFYEETSPGITPELLIADQPEPGTALAEVLGGASAKVASEDKLREALPGLAAHFDALNAEGVTPDQAAELDTREAHIRRLGVGFFATPGASITPGVSLADLLGIVARMIDFGLSIAGNAESTTVQPATAPYVDAGPEPADGVRIMVRLGWQQTPAEDFEALFSIASAAAQQAADLRLNATLGAVVGTTSDAQVNLVLPAEVHDLGMQETSRATGDGRAIPLLDALRGAYPMVEIRRESPALRRVSDRKGLDDLRAALGESAATSEAELLAKAARNVESMGKSLAARMQEAATSALVDVVARARRAGWLHDFEIAENEQPLVEILRALEQAAGARQGFDRQRSAVTALYGALIGLRGLGSGEVGQVIQAATDKARTIIKELEAAPIPAPPKLPEGVYGWAQSMVDEMHLEANGSEHPEVAAKLRELAEHFESGLYRVASGTPAAGFTVPTMDAELGRVRRLLEKCIGRTPDPSRATEQLVEDLAAQLLGSRQ